MTDKELELRKEFDNYFWFDGSISTTESRLIRPFTKQLVFDWFFSKIQEKDSQLRAKEEQLKAAKEVITLFMKRNGYNRGDSEIIKALETYKKLNP